MARYSPPKAYWYIRQRKRRAAAGGGSVPPLASYDFTTGVYDGPAISNVNAAGGMVDNLAGVWTSVAPNTLRRSNKGLLVEPARTNAIRNSVGSGAPDNWSNFLGLASGVTGTLIGTGTEDGIPYVEIKYQGTASGARQMFFETTTQVVAAQGETWSVSFFLSATDVTAVGTARALPYLREANAAGGTLANGQPPGGGNPPIAIGSLGGRRSPFTRTLVNASTARLIPGISLTMTAATAYDFTLRFGAPQLEQGSDPTSPIITTGGAASRAADAVSLTLPAGSASITYTFDDGSTQTVSVSPGSYTIPTNLNRPYIRSMKVMA